MEINNENSAKLFPMIWADAILQQQKQQPHQSQIQSTESEEKSKNDIQPTQIRTYNKVDFDKLKSRLQAISENENKPLWLRNYQESLIIDNVDEYARKQITAAMSLPHEMLGYEPFSIQPLSADERAFIKCESYRPIYTTKYHYMINSTA